jgi:hypothetical protein
MLTKEILQELQKPFPASEIKFKIQAKLKPPKDDTGIIVAYLDARNVMERLDEVVGGEWSDVYQSVQVGAKVGAECQLNILGVTRSDVGDPESDGMDSSLKSAYSDAFKRAAVKFGIGRFLYSLPKMYAKLKDGKYIQDGELVRLQNLVENHLANNAVGEIMKTKTLPESTIIPSRRTWSFEQMDAILENENNGEFDSYEMIEDLLNMSVLPADAPAPTVSAWFNVLLKSKQTTAIARADDANKAYIKHKKS